MKKKTSFNSSLKLKLHRETLRALDPPELTGIVGGAPTIVTCGQVTCPISDCRRTCINGTCTC